MHTTHKDIKHAIIKSQHCQRNWDLSKDIPSEDIDLLIHAVTTCPSKQNVAFYKAHFVTNRSIIESIHSCTDGFTVNVETGESQTNSQTLANLLIAFEPIDYFYQPNNDIHRSVEIDKIKKTQSTAEDKWVLDRDQQLAIGIAAGYVNLVASMLGYSTGCCSCFNIENVSRILNAENGIGLLMGVGFKDVSRPRREHHLESNFVFPTKKKQPIEVNLIN
jgi:hypothetical protein